MPTLDFKGKPFVYSHHLSVPYRELIIDKDKSLPAEKEEPSLDDNLIIHGDNLEALKALLPRYAGKVDVIYIDPPYNTGNEGWAYNDNVNSPQLKEWLGKVVDAEDMERHDKWLCMMWPRLQLLRELLAPDGVILVSMDETEISNLYLLMDEVFDRSNRFENLIWKKRYGGGPKEKFFVNLHEYLLVYAKDKRNITRIDRPLTPSKIERYYRWTDKQLPVRGPYRRQPLEAAKSLQKRENLRYPIEAPDSSKLWPNYQWLWEEDRYKSAKADDEIEILPSNGGWSVQYKQYLNDESGIQRTEKQQSILNANSDFIDGIYTQTGSSEIRSIFGGVDAFPYPKPSSLLTTILEAKFHPKDHASAVVLDSFAGSGTTAHAVLAANHADGGKRKFILIQLPEIIREDQPAYELGFRQVVDVTAERVRRVIGGVPNAKNDALREGLGGSFTYCKLGEPMDMERFFAEDGTAPEWDQVARYVAYTATGETLAPAEGPDGFAGHAGKYRLHLLYRPDAEWMRSNEAMLDLTTAERIAEAAKADGGKPVLIFAAGKLMGQRVLTGLGLTFCQLPYSVHRILGDGTEGVAGIDAA
ncbi:site-specific DNA-methyltransferase [Croceibacterium aestuarii]|uniref:site-specific DNA-methyltransferase n=1 Tax=Croceibacterium aestuarii TaxID=3064139 RepID=UPI00272E91FF|nr:site-specific DNA-methyltransferase [Croceibacterium sp. D39]